MAWINPRYREITGQDPPSRAAVADRAPIVESGRRLASIVRQARGRPAEELRVSLDEYQGHPYLSVRLWVRGDYGWVPTKKGCSIRLSEARDVAEALVEGCRIADNA